MQQFVELVKKTGNRQKALLLELEKLAIININKETGYWMRGALSCKYAKDLLLPTDKLIDEQINEIESLVISLENQAKIFNVKLSGSARKQLDSLYIKKNILA